MWIVWTLVCFAVLAYLGYAWISALATKYEHTRDSLAVLIVLGLASAYLGTGVAGQIAPGWTLGPRLAIIVGVAFTLFTLFSFLSVNLWCSLITRRFDEKIAALEEEEEAILRRLDSSRWRAIRHAEYAARAGEPSGQTDSEDERPVLRRAVETWEQGGGAARIRSMKVLEWRQDMAGKPLDTLESDLVSVELEARSEPDDSRREQARAHAALLRLEVLEREAAKAATKPSVAQPRPRPVEDEGKDRDRLQAIQGEIELQRRAKAEFMRQRIRLSWRASK